MRSPLLLIKFAVDDTPTETFYQEGTTLRDPAADAYTKERVSDLWDLTTSRPGNRGVEHGISMPTAPPTE